MAFQYTSDILADAFFRAGEPTDGTSDYNDQALRYLNNLYLQICRGGAELLPDLEEDWTWLTKPSPGVLVLKPPITAGTLQVTRGSSTVVLSTAPVDYAGANVNVSGWFLKITPEADLVRVSSHLAADTTLILDAPFTGSTASAAGYTLFLTDYDLATDVLRVIAPMRTFRNSGWNSRDDYKIYSASLDVLEEAYPLALIEQGIPDYFAPINSSTSGTRRVRFNRCGGPDPSTAYRVEYEYLYRPNPLTNAAQEQPVLPLEWRFLLSDYLTAYLLGIKHDDRVAGAAQAAQAGLRGMASENRYQTVTSTRFHFRLKPRMGGRQRARRVLRSESGMIIG